MGIDDFLIQLVKYCGSALLLINFTAGSVEQTTPPILSNTFVGSSLMIDSIVSLIVIAFLIQYPPYLKYSTQLSLSCESQYKLLFCVSHCS